MGNVYKGRSFKLPAGQMRPRVGSKPNGQEKKKKGEKDNRTWARYLQEQVGKGIGVPFKGIDWVNVGLAKATNIISNAIPPRPAAHLGCPSISFHGHANPLFPFPVPSLGIIFIGGQYDVRINGMPSARVGDMGIASCVAAAPPGIFEIYTGSSNVFIGGARAARMGDLSMHCWPAPKALDAARIIQRLAGLTIGLMLGVQITGYLTQVAGMVADGEAKSKAEKGAENEGKQALAKAYGLRQQNAAAQMAADLAALAAGMIPIPFAALPPVGVVAWGSLNVLIGGLPFPSGLAMAMRAIGRLKKRKKVDKAEVG
jgi:uncharacterized Zn-binding protein involved in type VI secretion